MLTWNALRAAGIGTYLMLWATVCWGLVGTAAVGGKRISRATAVTMHQFLATTAFVLLGLHIGLLLVDSFVPFGPLDVAVPLHSSYERIPVALGIGATYLFALVLLSSWIRKRIGTKLWRTLHLLAVPSFALALVHGVFAGTDTARPWMWWGYVATGGIALFLMLVRTMTIGLRPRRAALPENVRARAAAKPARERTPVG
jgi:sulfoxide reductase heme-binding subunit YedZ